MAVVAFVQTTVFLAISHKTADETDEAGRVSPADASISVTQTLNDPTVMLRLYKLS